MPKKKTTRKKVKTTRKKVDPQRGKELIQREIEELIETGETKEAAVVPKHVESRRERIESALIFTSTEEPAYAEEVINLGEYNVKNAVEKRREMAIKEQRERLELERKMKETVEKMIEGEEPITSVGEMLVENNARLTLKKREEIINDRKEKEKRVDEIIKELMEQ